MISSTLNWTDLNHLGDELLGMLRADYLELTEVGRSPTVGATIPYWDPGLCEWRKGVSGSMHSVLSLFPRCGCDGLSCFSLLPASLLSPPGWRVTLNCGPQQSLSPLNCFCQSILAQQWAKKLKQEFTRSVPQGSRFLDNILSREKHKP